MDAGVTIPFHGGVARVVDLAALRESEAWREAFAGKAKDHRFYEIVEETLRSGFEHHYLVLEDESGTVRGVQPVFFVQQNLIEGVPALSGVTEAIRKIFPRFLTMRVLMVGCAAGEGHLGFCRERDETWVVTALFFTLSGYARRMKASLIVFKDFRTDYREALERLTENGYTCVPSMPMTKLSLGYTDFEQYFASLSKATCEVVTDVSAVVDEIYPLYLQVQARSKLKFETLTKEYFCSLGQRLPDRARFFLWRQEGRIVAFSLCLIHDGAIYDDYLGLDYTVALDLHLYFLSFRDIIRWSIAQGLGRYLSSPLNYEPKLHLGCSLMPLDLYVMHTSRWLNPLFGRAVKLLEPTRHDPVLPRFPNAHELLAN